jgi:hypothetical protein
MECEKVRDLFSALLEGEIGPSEEKAVREHLSSCSDCRSELERFTKTVHWLHSVEDAEVPDGFFADVQRKIEDRNKNLGQGATVKKRWFNGPFPFKLPIQAVAMVAVLFLVVYLTKMAPYERRVPKEADQAKALRSEVKKAEPGPVPKEMERIVTKPAPETLPQPPASAEKRPDAEQPPMAMQEERKAALPSPKNEMRRAEEAPAAAGGKGESPVDPVGRQRAAKKKETDDRAKELPHEITLRVSDRTKTLSQVHELIKQSGGEIVRTEENILIASMPVGSLPKFEKDLAEMGLPKTSEKLSLQMEKEAARSVSSAKEGEAAGSVSEAKKKDAQEKGKVIDSFRSVMDSKDRVVLRIVLLPE